jgi:hypothetical protein
MVRDRVSKLESQVRALEEKLKIFEGRFKGENLLRLIHEAEENERLKKERENIPGL